MLAGDYEVVAVADCSLPLALQVARWRKEWVGRREGGRKREKEREREREGERERERILHSPKRSNTESIRFLRSLESFRVIPSHSESNQGGSPVPGRLC